MKILFVVPYPLEKSPSQRFRFEQYFESLKQRGHDITVKSFLSDSAHEVLKIGTPFEKFLRVTGALMRRPGILVSASSHDIVFIHREAAPVGPPVLEWIISKVLRKKIIYDFDDAIWLTDKTSEGGLQKALRWRNKVKWICRWSYKVSCGNRFLTEYASQFNSLAYLNPTTVDTVNTHNPLLFRYIADQPHVTIVWTGSSTTIKYLKLIEPILQKLQQEFPTLQLIVIADQPPGLKLERMEFVSWSPETEVEGLCRADIGIMPLPDDMWSKGKCGFKALQYMAMGLPAVVSAVGANLDIISHGTTGFLASSESEWCEVLRRLIVDQELRRTVGINGRKHVEQHYSVSSNEANFVSLFR